MYIYIYVIVIYIYILYIYASSKQIDKYFLMTLVGSYQVFYLFVGCYKSEDISRNRADLGIILGMFLADVPCNHS